MKKVIQEHYGEIQDILDAIKVGIFITDGFGNVLILNKEAEKTGGLSKNELWGCNISALIKQGYVDESTIPLAIEKEEECSIIQKLGDGGQLFITGTPIIKNSKVKLVVCTERNITETIELGELLKENQEQTEKYRLELERLRKVVFGQEEIIAESYAMRKVIERTLRIAKADTTVLVTGESGTGKELLAKLIYQNSLRSSKPFFRINCAAIPENLLESEFFGYEKGAFTGANKEGKKGIFEVANQGTLFLDEVGELPISMQAKLLRVLQEKEIMRVGGTNLINIDTRIIAATNRDLEADIREGRFRKDLYYRLNIFPINIPPLRERKEDIEKLAYHFTEQFSLQYKIKKRLEHDAILVLIDYDWPGNIRELRNVIERVALDCDDVLINRFQVIRQLSYGKAIDQKSDKSKVYFSLKKMLEEYEKTIIQELMRKYDNASTVARILDVNKSTISKKRKKI